LGWVHRLGLLLPQRGRQQGPDEDDLRHGLWRDHRLDRSPDHRERLDGLAGRGLAGHRRRRLSVVPANVYGYAAIVGYSLHQPSVASTTAGVPGTGPLQNLATPSFANPLILLIVSLVLGALFGYVSGQLAKALTTKHASA
jgi:hypothetical protein